MVKSFLTLFLLLQTYVLHSQVSSLDSIFADPKKKLIVSVGSDLIRTGLGTPNVASELLFNELWYVRGEFGISPFGYREFFFLIEPGVVSGRELTFATGGYFWNSPWSMNTAFSLGFEYQHWNYSSTNIGLVRKNGFYDYYSSNEDSYWYELSPSYEFRFDNIVNAYGFKFGADYKFRDHIHIIFGFHLSLIYRKVKFDPSNSFGVNWIGETPNGWKSGSLTKLSGLGRPLSITINYRI